jgi:ABC-type antimicrobial peptide transport system permease subunit
MALGSSGGRTIGLVVRNSLTLLAAGVATGLVVAFFVARSMRGVLYGIGPFDLPAFSIAALGLVAAGLLATLLPALRATRVDPMIALREP